MKYTVSLKQHHLFRRMYSKGRQAVRPTVVVCCRRNRTEQNRLGLTASTKIGNAVTRNRARRRLREVYRLHEEEFLPGYDIVLIARGSTAKCRWQRLEQDFLKGMEKLGLCRREQS